MKLAKQMLLLCNRPLHQLLQLQQQQQQKNNRNNNTNINTLELSLNIYAVVLL